MIWFALPPTVAKPYAGLRFVTPGVEAKPLKSPFSIAVVGVYT